MKVETFLICDSVQSLPNGKHIIQRERREFVVNNVPSKSHPISMPIYISLAKGEQGMHRVGFTIKSERGEKASDGYELAGDFTDSISFVYKDVLRFASVGNYIAQLILDDKTVAKWFFEVKLLH